MARQSRPWFRFYVEAPTDLKIRRLTPEQRWLWVCVLGMARRSPIPGKLMLTEDIPNEPGDLAWYSDMPIEAVEDGLRVMESLKLIVTCNDVITVTKWDERQYEGDFARQRISNQLRNQVFDRDGGECQECGTTEDLTIDHIIPRTKNGPTELDNLQLLCRTCNSRKGNRTRQQAHRSRNAVTAKSQHVTAPDTETDTEKELAPKTARKPDPIFDALCEVCDLDPKQLTPSARGALNKARKEIAGLEATDEDVRRKAHAYRVAYPGMALTPSALAKHWPSLDAGLTRPTTVKPSAYGTPTRALLGRGVDAAPTWELDEEGLAVPVRGVG